MDLGSPDKSIEEIEDHLKLDGPPFVGKLDLNLAVSKDEETGDGYQHDNESLRGRMQVDSNQMENPGSPVLPVDFSNGLMQSPIMKSYSAGPSSPLEKSEAPCSPIKPDLHRDGMEREISHNNPEGMRSEMEDYHSHNKKEGLDYGGFSGELLGSSPDESFNNGVDSTNNPYEETQNENFSYQGSKSPTFDETVDGDFVNVSEHSQFGKGIDEEIGAGNPSFHTEMKKDFYPSGMESSDNEGIVRANSGVHSPQRTQSGSPSPERQVNEEIYAGNSSFHTEVKKDFYPSDIIPSDNGGTAWVNSGMHSPHGTHNGSPSPERRLSVSAEMSPHTQPSARKRLASPANSAEKLAHSPNSFKRKRTPSPERHPVSRKRTSSRDGLSPSARRKSPSGRTTQRDPHLSENSPRKRLSVSPRRRESPERRNRSLSRSPARRRDSSVYRRDHRDRSRSRSPYSRDHYRRSPRRRHSPRRRSPPSGYRGRRRSPRRQWSPPANRSTGVGKPGNNLFVAGFSFVTTERDLEKKFSKYGRVTDVRIVRDRRSGDSRGFGFLSLEKDEDADAAIRALDQTEWNGRIVLVEKSKTPAR